MWSVEPSHKTMFFSVMDVCEKNLFVKKVKKTTTEFLEIFFV